jgi:hypothetical protein
MLAEFEPLFPRPRSCPQNDLPVGYFSSEAYAATLIATSIGQATETSSADRLLLNARREAYNLNDALN